MLHECAADQDLHVLPCSDPVLLYPLEKAIIVDMAPSSSLVVSIASLGIVLP